MLIQYIDKIRIRKFTILSGKNKKKYLKQLFRGSNKNREAKQLHSRLSLFLSYQISLLLKERQFLSTISKQEGCLLELLCTTLYSLQCMYRRHCFHVYIVNRIHFEMFKSILNLNYNEMKKITVSEFMLNTEAAIQWCSFEKLSEKVCKMSEKTPPAAFQTK